MFFTKCLRTASWILSGWMALVGIGWLSGWKVLTGLDPFATPVSFSAAAGLTMTAAAMARYLDFRTRPRPLLAYLLAAWGLLFLFSNFYGFHLPIDRLVAGFFGSRLPFTQMASGTAICLFLFGLALVFFNGGRNYQLIIAGSIACFVGWIGLISLLGHSIETDLEMTWAAYSRMMPSSAMIMVLLGFSLPIAIYFHHRHHESQFYAPAFYVALLFISITVLTEQAFVHLEVQKNRQAIDFKSESLAWEIKSTLGAQYQAFHRMAGRLENHTYNDARDWTRDVRGFMQDFKGIRAMAWIDNALIIRWHYPLRSPTLIGTDMKQDVDRAALINKARDSRQDSFSRPLDLFGGGRGTLLFIPVHAQGRFEGTLEVVYEFKNLFPQIVNLKGYSLTILEKGEILYQLGVPDASVSSRWVSRQQVELLGRWWDLVLTPDRETLQNQASAVPGAVLFFGFIISTVVCLAAYFYMSTREAEKKIREVASWQSAIMEGSNFVIVSTGVDRIVKSYNRAAEKLLGYSSSEIIGKFTPELWHDPGERAPAELEANMLAGKSTAFECTFISKDRRRHRMHLVVGPLFGDSGEISGFVGIGEDVTEKRIQEEKMMTSSRLASLGEMAAGIAHEINNPLTIIGAHASSVRRSLENGEECEPESLSKKMAAIERTVQRIARIIRGLRSFAREVPEEQIGDIDLNGLLDETLSFCAERFKNADIELSVDVPAGLTAKGREHQLSQVLLNLLNNAFDATRKSERREVGVTARARGDQVEIAVEDSGPGVPADLRDKIMQPFFTTKEVGQGLGLGLSISRGIIAAAGGQLTLDEHSERTRFIIRLPA